MAPSGPPDSEWRDDVQRHHGASRVEGAIGTLPDCQVSNATCTDMCFPLMTSKPLDLAHMTTTTRALPTHQRSGDQMGWGRKHALFLHLLTASHSFRQGETMARSDPRSPETVLCCVVSGAQLGEIGAGGSEPGGLSRMDSRFKATTTSRRANPVQLFAQINIVQINLCFPKFYQLFGASGNFCFSWESC